MQKQNNKYTLPPGITDMQEYMRIPVNLEEVGTVKISKPLNIKIGEVTNLKIIKKDKHASKKLSDSRITRKSQNII